MPKRSHPPHQPERLHLRWTPRKRSHNLQITLRNRARHAVAFPYLELEILDLGGQPQVRRAFAPMEYAGGAADFTRGMPSGAEWNVKLFIDASSVSARGYNLDLFYP